MLCRLALEKLFNLIQDVRKKCNQKDIHPPWTLEESSFENMGALMGMAENDGEILGLYDELVYRS